MATSLFEHKKIHTTEAKAKELRPYAESLITKAKTALAREKQNLLPEGQSIDIHSRRMVYRTIRNKGVLQELFDSIAPVVENRNGGYCRITKTGTRRGDAGRTAIIELVDWSAPVDGATSLKRKKKTKSTTAKKATPKVAPKSKTSTENKVETPVVTEEEVIENTIAEVVESPVEAVVEETATVISEEPSTEENTNTTTDEVEEKPAE
jgi:large subunit ribosomal protein L17